MVVQKDRILIYISSDEVLKFKPFKKISKKISNCQFAVLTSMNIAIAHDNMISLYTFTG